MSFHVATFYRFVEIADPPELRRQIHRICEANDILGTCLVAGEGINATVAGSEAGIRALLAELHADARFSQMEVKYSTASERPFRRLKVRLRREIVTLGAPEAAPSVLTGTRVPAAEWDELISDPEVILIDTRNSYEVGIGTFPGAIDPRTRSFGAFKDYVAEHLDPSRDKRIAMFCTGGIRCEKASAYLLTKGFENVYQLEGGILKYLEEIPAERSSWQGECFVFDRRVALLTGLAEGTYRLCWDCGMPLPDDAKCECATSSAVRAR